MSDDAQARGVSVGERGTLVYPAEGGEMEALMRRKDWSQTRLGPRERWPQSLRTALSIVLSSRFPMIIYWGRDLCVLYNDAYATIFASKHPEVLGKTGFEAWGEIWDVIDPMFRAVMERGETTWSRDQHLALCRKGYTEECYFTWSFSPITDESGGVGGVFTAVNETTDRVLAERRLITLRELGESVALAKTVHDACRNSARIIEKNPTDVPFALIYLHEPGKTTARLAGTAGIAAHHPAAPAEITIDAAGPWPVAEVLASGEPRVLHRVDDRFNVSLPCGPWPEPAHTAIVLPIAGADVGQRHGFIVAGVSPRRELDEQYRGFLALLAGHVGTAVSNASAYEAERRRAEALAEIDRAKTAFFSNISHEFRTPLTLMLGPQEDALARPGGVLAGDDLRAVHRNTVRLHKLVNALLDFSRMEAGRIQASYEATDLSLLTRDLASAFRSAFERASLRLDVDCPALRETVHVDRTMWEKIVLNLLSNAFKFTFDGGVTVRLREVNNAIELQVTDTGVGIPEHELPHVFERFHRIEGTRARTHEGSGIGLALVHDLVGLHGGSVRVVSRQGEGTTFTVRIPWGTAHLPAERVVPPRALAPVATDAFVTEALRWLPANSTDETPHGEPQPGSLPRIFVVDDNADMRGYIARLLRSTSTVVEFADGAQALAAALRAPPDLIVTDVMMPNLDGFGLLRALREAEPTAQIPIIMLSARAGEESRVEGLQSGADDYLAKPFSAKELRARVSLHLQLARTRRESAEQRDRLERLLYEAPAMISLTEGPEHRFTFFSRATEAIFPRNLLGLPVKEALPEVEAQNYLALLDQVYRTGERFLGIEMPLRIDKSLKTNFRDGVFVDFIYAPIRDGQGQVSGVFVLATDVTERVLGRQALEKATAEAHAANRAKDEFMAMLGHELRNPLSPISTALQVMRLRGTSSRELEIIERQVDNLSRLVDDLLDVSRIAGGKIQLDKTRIELSAVVLQGLETASPLLESRHQKVDLRVPQTGLVVHGDLARLAQVTANLLTNASKYSEPGTTIRIVAERGGLGARLRVRDEGMGIPRDMLDRVFDLFIQQAQALDRAQGGLGLGLTIVRSLVRMHGGTVSAASEGAGKGSEFVVELPLLADDEAFDKSSTKEQRAFSADLAVASGRRILIVDDNEDAAEMLADLLRDLGYEVQVAHDGPSALALATGYRPDLGLLDIGLPVMDGYELARRLRSGDALAPGARLVAITGYGQDSDRQKSKAAGFDEHLVKPFDFDALSRIVAN